MSENNSEIKEKVGFKTTEFYVLLLVMLLGVLMQSGAFGDQHWAMKAGALLSQTLAALGYTMARARTKFGSSVERASLGKPKAAKLFRLPPPAQDE
jgi:hypothetical protein